jgi:DNA-binding beta-propeller fold protein YncE
VLGCSPFAGLRSLHKGRGLKQTSDDTVVGSIAVGNGPRGLAVTPDGVYVCVANLL